MLFILNLLLLCTSYNVYSMQDGTPGKDDESIAQDLGCTVDQVQAWKQLEKAAVKTIKKREYKPQLFVAHCTDGTTVYADHARPILKMDDAQVWRSVRSELHEHKHAYIAMDPKYLNIIKMWYHEQERKQR